MPLTYAGNTPRGPSGQLILKPGAAAHLELFKSTQRGVQFRPYPELDANGNAVPMRVGVETGDLTDWITELNVLDYVGGHPASKEKITLLAEIRGDRESDMDRAGEIWMRLCNTVKTGVESGQRPYWYVLVQNRKDSPLGTSFGKNRIRPNAFMRGALTYYMLGDGPLKNANMGHPRPNVILRLTPNATKSLVSAIQDLVVGYSGDQSDYAAQFTCGDIVDPVKGKLLQFRRPQSSGPDYGNSAQTPNFGLSGGTNDDDDENRFKYECIVGQTYQVPLSVIQKHYLGWDEMLKIWDSEQHFVEALCRGFPDDVLIEAYGNTDWLPKSISKGQTISVPQGGPAPHQQAPQQQVPQGYPQQQVPQGYPQQQVPQQQAPQQQVPQQQAPQQQAPQQVPADYQQAPQQVPADYQQAPQQEPQGPQEDASLMGGAESVDWSGGGSDDNSGGGGNDMTPPQQAPQQPTGDPREDAETQAMMETLNRAREKSASGSQQAPQQNK